MYVYVGPYLSVTTCVHTHTELQCLAFRIFSTVFLKLKAELVFKHELKCSRFPRLQHLALFLRPSSAAPGRCREPGAGRRGRAGPCRAAGGIGPARSGAVGCCAHAAPAPVPGSNPGEARPTAGVSPDPGTVSRPWPCAASPPPRALPAPGLCCPQRCSAPGHELPQRLG